MSAQNSSPKIPEGYIAIDGPDNIKYVVPRFMIPSLEHDLAVLGSKEDPIVNNADLTRKPNAKQSDSYLTLSGILRVPPENSLTDHEMLALHSEVQALKQSLGISYKDAAHRLYMAEVAKLKVADTDRRYHAYIDRCIAKTLTKLEERHSVREDLGNSE
ncbi:hypothetical protein JR316_0006153 [Psilocybe cubensis]|uniref:Uncharacterized protein n=2 Tax=Psilocybe cubensis TaxID=181762 RepID=A0A8H7XYQ1_PSICU|nr:hypothetical protein JR316_0006153 [Psilocybe cubensis]KAH9481626.1 hypothetical protein JR316_0006153 [Psilocybe cubensis]